MTKASRSKCQFCDRPRRVYVYARGVNPLDSSAQACADHAEQARKFADAGHGTATHDLSAERSAA